MNMIKMFILKAWNNDLRETLTLNKAIRQMKKLQHLEL